MHFVNFLTLLLGCYGFTRIHEVVVDQPGCRPPNQHHDLLSTLLRLGKMPWGLIHVQPLI
ncbi:unnamed protein product [Haemonchus placei]|uniref:Secreted protein n=1 Tax=Haemonchus placei TaxID=6290 RepID=A0A0N4W3F5_HAEPC|nr:unnamed protein product [Haemonchus placei]